MRAVMLTMLLLCSTASAQSGPGKGIVRGAVLRDPLLTPIAGAEVRLAPAGLSVRTASDGAFTFRRVPAGQQRLTVRAVGFNEAEAILTVPLDGADGIEVTLTQAVATLEKVTVNKDAVPRHLEEFESRRKFGIGRFLDSTQLWTHGDASRWFERVVERTPGLRLVPLGISRTALAFGQRRCVNSFRQDRPCFARVFVDDQLLTDSESGFDVTAWSGPTIVAVEYYTVSQLPPRYNRLGDLACGAVLLWTQR